MLIVKNNIIPFKGFKAIYLFGFLFTRGDSNEHDLTYCGLRDRYSFLKYLRP